MWDESWKDVFDNVLSNENFCTFELVKEERKTKKILPGENDVFNALKLSLEDLRVVILGQDPYPNESNAHGYSFSVPKGVPVPASLRNIFKEAKITSTHGNLESWVDQGVLLLNTVLTVEQGKPGSHRRLGWQLLTKKILEFIVEKKENVVFLLWGRDAQKQASTLTFKSTHLVLESAHPSPLGAHYSAPVPFLGCNHFELVNEYLKKNGLTEIDWNLQ